MAQKFAIGLDYGTESGRAVLVDLSNGDVVAQSVKNYPDGVIDEKLPGTDIQLEPDWALQNPNDYVDVFIETVRTVLQKTGGTVSPNDIIGIGVDFTACTVLPVKEDGTPLSNLPELKDNPHSWLKLWKHHAAQDEANQLNEIAEQMDNSFLPRYGGKISSEWLFPKIWQVVDEAPEIYDQADKFIEAADWIVWQMTGKETRNSCTAGYKGMWHKQQGYPDSSFFKNLHPKLEHVVDEKLSRDILPIGSKAGELTAEMASKTGLPSGIAVAVANVDAHVSAPAAGVVNPGAMLLIMGTSTCNILLSDVERIVPGMCGVVEDGAIPGYFAYEAGQSGVGDVFAWFTNHAVPESYEQEARKRNLSIHELLEEKMSKLKVGESGILALDWLNGNRSILVDVDLTGCILGVTLDTKPEEIYRALIEATAFGQRMIIETFEESGVPVKELVACGGLPHKNRMLMQIYADVFGKEIAIAEHLQAPAIGSAMFGAVAAGKDAGGFDSVVEAAEKMAKLKEEKVKPIAENTAVYTTLYNEYKRLHDYFGRGENNVMKLLKKLKRGDVS